MNDRASIHLECYSEADIDLLDTDEPIDTIYFQPFLLTVALYTDVPLISAALKPIILEFLEELATSNINATMYIILRILPVFAFFPY